MRAASVTLGHGAAAFGLSGVACLASLTDTSPWRMSGDNVDVEGIIGRRTGGMHAGDAGCRAEQVMRKSVVVGALETQAQTILADVALAVATDLSSSTSDAGV